MTAKAKQRSGVSPRGRENRGTSVGSGENSARASGSSGRPAEVRGPATCTRTPPAAKKATKVPVYHAGAAKGSTMETETPDVVTETPAEGAVVAVTPPVPEAELTPRALLGGLAIDDPQALRTELERYATVRGIFVDWLFSHLVAGIDYMLIHRKVGPRGNKQDCPNRLNATGSTCGTCTGKATLCKPGSEKLCGLLQLRPRFKRDLETWEMLGGDPGLVALICELIGPTGIVVAEGRGARQRDQDYGDVNKTVKMVQKSAQVDAVLRCAGLSELFSQDIEDMPGFSNGDADEAGDFGTPRSKSAPPAVAAPAAPVQSTLEQQLEASVRRTAPAPSRPTPPRPTPSRPAPRPGPPTRPVPRGGAQAAAPSDALSPARISRLMAMLHEAIRGAEVPQEEHEGIFAAARAYLTDWVVRTQGRERLSDCSWKSYDELCAQIPAAVDAALGGEGPAPRPRPRLVRRGYSAPRQYERRAF